MSSPNNPPPDPEAPVSVPEEGTTRTGSDPNGGGGDPGGSNTDGGGGDPGGSN